MERDKIEIGDTIEIIGTDFKVEVTGFTEIAGSKMVSSKYGDFNIDLVKKISDENC